MNLLHMWDIAAAYDLGEIEKISYHREKIPYRRI